MKKVVIYTDGACSGNPGPGGWGAVLEYADNVKEISGGAKDTTNNKMELQAVIEGLKLLKESCEVTVVTDSMYVKNGITKWIHNWVKNNWKTAAKKPVKNKEFWVNLLELTKNHKINWEWIRGHSGHPQNERCDTLATNERDRIKY